MVKKQKRKKQKEQELVEINLKKERLK